MSGATHTMRRMWLIMLHQRGNWTVAELNHELHKHHPSLPNVDEESLKLLVLENRLSCRNNIAGEVLDYSVQPTNVALRTVTLGDLGLFDN
jgi:hypothetical protein